MLDRREALFLRMVELLGQVPLMFDPAVRDSVTTAWAEIGAEACEEAAAIRDECDLRNLTGEAQ